MRFIPKPIRRFFERPLKKIFYFGFQRYCPVCRSRVRLFQQHPVDGRLDAQCPVCHSFERFRMVWLFLDKKHDELFDGKSRKMLHIAPEKLLERRFRKIENLDYLSADLTSPAAMVKMDITDIQYPDESFDMIFCCHVLEHIPKDRKAIRELYRVLKKEGWAIIQVPGRRQKTFENTDRMDPQERRRIFGHESHYHLYGPDLVDRLKEAGFNATCVTSGEIMSPEDKIYFGVREQRIYYARKS